MVPAAVEFRTPEDMCTRMLRTRHACLVLLYATASGRVFHYHVDMNVPATNFVGHFSVFDITAGKGGGRTLELVFAGDVPTTKLRGHKYSGSLDGEADFAGVPVATVGPNYTTYTYNP